jgi:peptidoglycan/LPS O-acetylase OafA/YrhL
MGKERKKRLYKLAGWTWSWVATMAIATFGPKYIWDDHAVLTVLAVCVNLANGILMLVANHNLFNDFDELERKIHLEAMALTLGLAVVVGLSYSLLDTTNIIPTDAEIGNLVLFIGITYLVCLGINTRRYK